MRHPRLSALAFFLLASAAAARAATVTYAATTIGPYKTTDGGTTWQPVKVTVSSTLLQGIPDVASIAIDPLNPSNIYFIGRVSGTSAFYRSTDAGQTWSAVLLPGINVGTNDRSNYWLCIDPVVTSTLYIAATVALRSTDSGATWSPMTDLNTFGGLTGINGMAIDPKASGVLYASKHGAVAKSTDFGVTWKTLVTFTNSPTTAGIFVNPRNTRQLFVARVFGQGCTDQNRQLTDCGMFQSLDAGQTWQIVPVPGSVRFVDFDRTNGDIYAGGSETGIGSTVLKSSDQGVTWTPLLKFAGGINDGPAVSVDPGATGNVYSLGDTSGGGGNLQKTVDGGATWKKTLPPPYCTGFGPPTAACPAGAANTTPQVYALAYVPPPPPPAVSVAATVSAASGLAGPVAAESIVIATGSHIATGPAAGDYDNPPLILAGTTINVTDSAGITRPAVIFSISPTQATYQIPPGTAPGAATVTITAGDGVTGTVQVQIAAVAPGLYTLNAGGLPRAYVFRVSNGNQFIEDVFDIDPSGAVIPRPITVSNGDQVYLFVYGTGFRAAGGDTAVTVGGESAPVLYAGPQGVQPGLDQFQILIPADQGSGTPQSVQIVFTAANQTANTVNVTLQ